MTHDIILGCGVFASSALITSRFVPMRFIPLLWGGTFGGIIAFLTSRFTVKKLGLENSLAKWVPSFILAMGLFNIQSLAHEGGHAFAGRILLHHPEITIKIIPFFGGSTKFVPMIASSFGQSLKAQNVFAVIAACGPLTSLGFSYFLLQWGIKRLEVHATTGRLAICAATIDILFHFRSAISALKISPTSLQYDFVALRTLVGIHPLVCAAAIVGLAALLAYRASTQKKADPTSL